MRQTITTLLSVVAISAIAPSILTNPALAQHNIYGRVGQLWAEGAQHQASDNFAAAEASYEQAVEAARELENPTLKDCAISGSLVRSVSMQRAQAYLEQQGRSPQTLAQAHELVAEFSAAAWDVVDQQRPDLANSCP